VRLGLYLEAAGSSPAFWCELVSVRIAFCWSETSVARAIGTVAFAGRPGSMVQSWMERLQRSVLEFSWAVQDWVGLL